MAETAIFMGPFDETGNIGHRGAAIFRKIDHADQRVKRCEGIRRCLGFCGREFSEEG